ncbi:alpha/beta hydrolase family protein [Williamsia sp.]|uniref:alpha/beta hydrolase n=1 Tax=Williamsia sp. TaxID=1872085 RepID=UPI001A33F852|nr:alpha/beta hydrolase family protein [Williamsia sp.]MBJ7289437.1 esterase family protein [Williamsia sp.]
MRRRIIAAVATSFALVGGSVGVIAPSSAAPEKPSVAAPAAPAKIVRTTMKTPQQARLTIYSPAMRKNVVVDVLVPRDRTAPRPTLYMLDGIDAGFQSGYRDSAWTTQTDIVEFMADKNVNVVLPIGGTASYYTDWQRTDPVLGVIKWDTFLSTELPPLIDKTFEGNGVNAVEGVSMGASGAMSLAVRHPGLFRGVVALSGCLDLVDPAAAQATQASILSRFGNPDNMWGPAGSAAWRQHDPTTNISALKGTEIYVAVGDGKADPRLGKVGQASAIGGALETGALMCTKGFSAAARKADVDVTYNYRSGLHAWGYWAQDLHRSWPTVVKALGLPPVDPADYR